MASISFTGIIAEMSEYVLLGWCSIVFVLLILFVLIILWVWSVYSLYLKSSDDLPVPEKYNKLDSGAISSIPDEKLEDAVISYILSQTVLLKDKSGTDIELPPSLMAVYSTYILENEVYNGGFLRFFWKYSYSMGKKAEESLKRMGAHEYHEIVAAANSIYQEDEAKITKIKELANETYDEIEDDPFDELDDRFFNLAGKEDLSTLRIKYIRENADSFDLSA